MDLKLVNPQAKYAKVTLIDPPPLGYIHLAAAVDPPPGPTPIPGNSPRKAALLIRLRSLARQLETLTTVERASVYRAILIAPPAGFAKAGTHVARYDVVALIETTSPEVLGEVQATEPYRLLVEAVTEAATDVHVMTARCPKRVGEVDKTRQGLFLFNYFVADDAAVALQLWDYLAGWYAAETGLANSTLLEPLGDADYVFVNHARWDDSLPRFLLRQLTKPSFRTYCSPTCRPTGPARCRSSTDSPHRHHRRPDPAEPDGVGRRGRTRSSRRPTEPEHHPGKDKTTA